MIRKKSVAFLMLSLITVMAAGCGKGATTAGSSPEASMSSGAGSSPSPSVSAKAEPAETGPIDLYIYSLGGDKPEDFENKYASLMKQKFPNYNIHLLTGRNGDAEKLDALLLTKHPIDLFYGSVGYYIAGATTNDFGYDLAPMVKQNNVDLSRFSSSLIDAVKKKDTGKLLGLPVITKTMVLYYNKELFDKFGVPYLKDGMTWDEIYNVNKLLTRTEGGTNYVGLAVSPAHWMQMNSYSQPFTYPDTGLSTLDQTDTWSKILNPMLIPAQLPDYQAAMKALDNKLPYSGEFQKTQTEAIFGIFSDWLITNPDVPFNWDMVSFPTFSDKPGIGPQQYPEYWGVTSISEHKEASFKVLQYLTSDEFQTIASKRGDMTVLNSDAIKSVFGQESINKNKNLKAVFAYKDYAPIQQYDENFKKVYSAVQKVLPSLALGEIDLNTALRQTKESVDKEIQAAKK